MRPAAPALSDVARNLRSGAMTESAVVTVGGIASNKANFTVELLSPLLGVHIRSNVQALSGDSCR